MSISIGPVSWPCVAPSKAQHILLDARRLRDLQVPQQSIVKGDGRSLTIAAASILAKTARDALMHKLDADYPGYGFSKHKGYPVREHLAALERLGASPIHRRSFAPVRAVLGLPPLPPWPNADTVSESIENAEQPETAPIHEGLLGAGTTGV